MMAVSPEVLPPGKDFSGLFNPRSIAVIGASQDLESISGQPIKHLKAKGFQGHVYPVNPRYDEVAGLRCYADILSVPETPDVAIVAIGVKRVIETMHQISEKGVPFAVVLTSGFAETGSEGKEIQLKLAEIALVHGIHVIGPNCQGYMNITDGIQVGFGTPYGLTYRKGGLSVTSQSGAFGNSVVMLADSEGVGFRYYVSTGNEAVTTSLDLFEYFLKDEGTRAIAGYVEGFKDAGRLVELGRRALRVGKPIIVWKVGTSEAGAKAAASHTANLGGSMALYRAAFRQSGIIQVSDVGDLADCAKALVPGRLPKGNRIVVVTISGGAGIAMADRCADEGLELTPLDARTVDALRRVLPSYAAVANPLDVTGSLLNDPGMLRQVPNIDMIGMALAGASGTLATEFAREVVRVSDELRVPVLVAWNALEQLAGEAYAILDRAAIPRYQSPVRCARAAGALWQYASARQRQKARDGEQVLAIERPDVRSALSGRKTDLTEFEAKGVLAHYGIPITNEKLAMDGEAAARIATDIGFPVAMKIQSSDIPHKTEAGGVRIGIQSAEAARSAFAEILTNAAKHAPNAKVDGVLVQEMVVGATEVILGVNNTPLFGPAIMFGLGGIFAEILRDVTFRLAPITRTEAHEMIREVRAFKVLEGARGRPKSDLTALADVLVRLSALAVDLKREMAELDINPLFVLPEGHGVKAGDALIKPTGV
jgi:acetate---CoA ligase (ADP-forming)